MLCTGVSNLEESTRQLIQQFGSAHINQVSYRESWVMIGFKGAPMGSVRQPSQCLATLTLRLSVSLSFSLYRSLLPLLLIIIPHASVCLSLGRHARLAFSLCPCLSQSVSLPLPFHRSSSSSLVSLCKSSCLSPSVVLCPKRPLCRSKSVSRALPVLQFLSLSLTVVPFAFQPTLRSISICCPFPVCISSFFIVFSISLVAFYT